MGFLGNPHAGPASLTLRGQREGGWAAGSPVGSEASGIPVGGETGLPSDQLISLSNRGLCDGDTLS